MDAFFCVDKPSAMTSFDVLREMRRTLGIKKIGHTGTLDPLATGCMIVATGNYTKCIPLLEKDRKSYQAHITLGGTSDSYDRDTDVLYLSDEQQAYFKEYITLEMIKELCDTHFLGNITQIPPKYSALKIDGKRALDRTLAGEEIQMLSRDAEVLSYKIVEYKYPHLVIDYSVSAGTYIRSLAHDLGQLLGCGAYIEELRRTAVGDIGIERATPLSDISPKSVLDPTILFPQKIYTLQEHELFQRLDHGQRVRGEYSLLHNEAIILSEGKDIRFIVKYIDGVVHPRKKIK